MYLFGKQSSHKHIIQVLISYYVITLKAIMSICHANTSAIFLFINSSSQPRGSSV